MPRCKREAAACSVSRAGSPCWHPERGDRQAPAPALPKERKPLPHGSCPTSQRSSGLSKEVKGRSHPRACRYLLQHGSPTRCPGSRSGLTSSHQRAGLQRGRRHPSKPSGAAARPRAGGWGCSPCPFSTWVPPSGPGPPPPPGHSTLRPARSEPWLACPLAGRGGTTATSSRQQPRRAGVLAAILMATGMQGVSATPRCSSGGRVLAINKSINTASRGRVPQSSASCRPAAWRLADPSGAGNLAHLAGLCAVPCSLSCSPVRRHTRSLAEEVAGAPEQDPSGPQPIAQQRCSVLPPAPAAWHSYSGKSCAAILKQAPFAANSA